MAGIDPMNSGAGILGFAVLVLTTCLTQAQGFIPEGPTDGSFVLHGAVVDASTTRMLSSGESGLRSRVSALEGAQTWTWTAGSGDTDVGKRDWPALLSQMYKSRDNAATVQSMIDGAGYTLLKSSAAGSFYKAFTCPGLSLYYFAYKSKLRAEHVTEVQKTLNNTKGYATSETGWQCLMRDDGHMDPIYSITEKNSENFCWMSRTAGVLFSHEFNHSSKAFFTGFMDNLVRGTFCTGRVEWDSNNYFGYCLQPLLVLYEHASTDKIKRQAQAMLDWMVITTAVHYLDGALVGPDIRAKSNDYLPFSGSFWPYGYAYFGGSASSVTESAAKANMDVNLAGWLPHSSYRPPQIAIDIAQRKYTTPVEMHNAKPFYRLDWDNYADWRGTTDRSRRFEFETIYLEGNYTLGSVATRVPDGRNPSSGGIGCFSEERDWMLGVKGTNGPLKVHGKAGAGSISVDNQINSYWGRNPYEEIGQYRNIMMRLIKGTDLMWVVIPASRDPAADGSTVFADMGNDVYLGITPYRGTGLSSATLKNDTGNRVFRWTFSASQLGALIVEVGTRAEYGSFAEFKTAVKQAQLTTPGTDQLQYASSKGRTLRMQFMAPGTAYSYHDKTTSPVTHPVAGTIPRVWCDGAEVDFAKFQSYHAVSGEPIVEQNWGSGALTASIGGKGIQIVIDKTTADVQWRSFSNTTFSGAAPRGRMHRAVLRERNSVSGRYRPADLISTDGRVRGRLGPAGLSGSSVLSTGVYVVRDEKWVGYSRTIHAK